MHNAYLYGDANLDGFVDVADFNDWNANKFTSTVQWDAGDFNGDRLVDVSDVNLWNSNKFRSSQGRAGDSLSAVPEPTSAAILMLAALVLCGLKRPSRQRSVT